jgi:hypothetical protein
MATVGVSDYLLQITYSTQGLGKTEQFILIVEKLELDCHKCANFHISLRSSSLRSRKDMVIMAGMAAVDVLYGLGVILLGVYRICIYVSGLENDEISAWDCMILPPVFLTIIATQLTSVMNTVVSVDRLFAVAWPFKYHTQDRKYALKMMVGKLCTSCGHTYSHRGSTLFVLMLRCVHSKTQNLKSGSV